MTAVEYLRDLQIKTKTEPVLIEDFISYRGQQLGNDLIKRSLNKYPIYTLEQQEQFYTDTFITPFLNSLPADAANSLRDVYVGLLPTYDPNAWVILVPNNGPLVVLHYKLLGAIHYYNQLFGLVVKLSDSDTAIAETLLDWGTGVILDFFREERDEKKDKIFRELSTQLTQEELGMTMHMTLSQELFVVAHEFAHIYLNHLGTYANKYIGTENNRVSIRAFSVKQQEELDADVQAVKWLINLKDRQTENEFLQFTADSIGLCVEILMLFDLVEVNFNLPTQLSSHPPSLIRLKNILEKCRHLLSHEDIELLRKDIVCASDLRLRVLKQKREK